MWTRCWTRPPSRPRPARTTADTPWEDAVAVKLIMFDVDGTLTDTCEAEVRLYVPAVEEALGIGGIDTDWSTYRNYTDPGVTSEVVERAWGRQATPEELARVCARWVALVDEDLRGVYSDAVRELESAA